METNVDEARKKTKGVGSVEKKAGTDEQRTSEGEASAGKKDRPVKGIKYGFHVFLVVLSRIIGGFQSLYERLFLVEEKVVGSDFHKERGFSAFEKGNYPKAVEHFLIASNDKDGKDPEVLFYIGLALAHQEEYTKAVDFLKRAEALKENDADIVSEIGNCLMKLERYRDAGVYLKKAINLTPEISGHFYALGTACEKIGELEEAIQSYSRAIELDPRDPLYYHALGFAYESAAKHTDAIACFKKAMELEKHHQ